MFRRFKISVGIAGMSCRLSQKNHDGCGPHHDCRAEIKTKVQYPRLRKSMHPLRNRQPTTTRKNTMERNTLQKTPASLSLALALLLVPLTGAPVAAQEPAAAKVVYPTDRTVLPIPEPKPPTITEADARNVTPPPRFEVKAPDGAPNVLIILIDDMGFGMSESFGGPIHMPTATWMAANGLRYNQFHTTALCSPTRSALMSGRNHHMNNFGSIAESATAFPGQTGSRPNSVAYAAEMVRLNGYSTAWFGKNTRLRRGKSAPQARPIAGRPARALTSFTDLWVARPTNGLLSSTTA
jgi:hypothetical protein